MFFYLKISCFLAILLNFTANFCLAAILEISNQSGADILNIYAQTPERPVFIRLDLAPGASGKVENPDCNATLRVDTGLTFWFFDSVNLKNALSLTFNNDHMLLIKEKDGAIKQLAAKIQSLVPQVMAEVACSLDKFYPDMPMKDVCAIIDQNTPVDDNGAYLTGIEFADLPWAGRLAPADNETNPVLRHLELRRELSKTNVSEILAYLQKRGYAPWQAEFPGKEMDLGAGDTAKNMALLHSALDKFLSKTSVKQKLQDNQQDTETEATIYMAPAESLQALANADDPKVDTQIFTIVLKPLTNTLLLDIAAYKGNEQGIFDN